MKVLNNIKLLVVTSIPFPDGLASTNRIISYSKGMVELGDEVTVLTSNKETNTGKKFSHFDGIKFRTFGIKSLFIPGVIMLVLSVLRMVWFILRNAKKYDSVLIVSNSIVLIYLTSWACKWNKTKLTQEKSEFPFVLNKQGIVGKKYANFYVNNIYRLFDGMIIMTHPLLDYFSDKTKEGCKKIVVPMTVEAERFENVESDSTLGEYIGYCGYIGGNKDGVENLIRSFEIVVKAFPNLKLLLIGPAGNEDFIRLKNIVSENFIPNVIFHGSVSRDEMPKLLCNAKILALARPSSLQSTGGFPTKLGEYLSTGNPSIVTSVGDIPRYLKDGEDAFIVAPDDNIKFAEKLVYILENYDKACQVAQNGKKQVYDTFSYKKQAKRMHDFYVDLINS